MSVQNLMCSRQTSRIVFLSVTLVILSVIAGCVETELNLIPGLPTTSDETETRALMRDLSVSISAIEDAGISNKDIDEQRAIIVSELNRIAALINQIESEELLQDPDQSDGDHDFVVKYLGTLASEVELARGQVEDENSDLFIAGQLAGVCRGCHDKLWPGS